MIEKWFKKDVEKIHSEKKIVVFIDESKKAKFMLDSINADIYCSENEIDELEIKYKIKKDKTKKKCVIYTQRPESRLKFLREYCETNGATDYLNLSKEIIKRLKRVKKQKTIQTEKQKLNNKLIDKKKWKRVTYRMKPELHRELKIFATTKSLNLEDVAQIAIEIIINRGNQIG